MQKSADGLLTLKEAASVAGRSYSWAWDCASDGRLDRSECAGNRVLVTAQSVRALLVREAVRAAGATNKPRLRLVIDNTE